MRHGGVPRLFEYVRASPLDPREDVGDRASPPPGSSRRRSPGRARARRDRRRAPRTPPSTGAAVMCGRSDPTSATVRAPRSSRCAIAARIRSPRSPSACGITQSRRHQVRRTSSHADPGVTAIDASHARRRAAPSIVSSRSASSSAGSGGRPSAAKRRLLPPARGRARQDRDDRRVRSIHHARNPKQHAESERQQPRVPEVRLHHPPEMDHRRDRRDISEPVELLPALPQPPNHRRVRRDRQRQQQQERRHADRDERTLRRCPPTILGKSKNSRGRTMSARADTRRRTRRAPACAAGWMISFHPVRRRSGVTVSEIARKVSAVSPVQSVM